MRVEIDFQLTDADDARLLVRAFLNHSLEEMGIYEITINPGSLGADFAQVIASPCDEMVRECGPQAELRRPEE